MLRLLFSICLFIALQASTTAPDIAAYFPIRQGDVWTYDWKYRVGNQPDRTVKRTRSFEGREFINAGFAQKLVSENGDYALFTVNEQGLFLHGAAEIERDVKFLFEPPIALLTKDMKPGQSVVVTQLEEDGKQTRRFTSVFEGIAAIETPMGKFEDCLKLRWEMEASVARQKTTYYLAKGIGIVAYQVEVKSRKQDSIELIVDARLKLLQLQGKNIANLNDLKTSAATPDVLVDNPKARSLFRQASENRYVWEKKFPGFEADFTVKRDGVPDVTGNLRVTRQFGVTVNCPDATARALVHAEVSQFVSYRQAKSFDESYGIGKATIAFAAADEVIVNDEEAAGSRYQIRDREVTRVSRSFGRVRFVINHVKNLKTDDSRTIASEFDITYYSNETDSVVSQTKYQDRYEKIGSYWLPIARTKTENAKEKTSRLELILSNAKYLK